MTSITVQVSDSYTEKILALLRQFSPAEVDVVDIDPQYEAHREQVLSAEAAYNRGEMETYTIEEADAMAEAIIRKYEG